MPTILPQVDVTLTDHDGKTALDLASDEEEDGEDEGEEDEDDEDEMDDVVEAIEKRDDLLELGHTC